MNLINTIGVFFAIALLALTGSYTGQNQSVAATSTTQAVVRLTVVDVQTGSEGHNLGDHRTFSKIVLGSKGFIIGSAFDSCVVVGIGKTYGKFGLSLCNGVYNLPKGKLTFQGTRRTRERYTFVITGGSGIYENASGTLNGFQISSNPYSQRVIIHIGR